MAAVLPGFFGLFSVIALCGMVVATVLAIIYNSPFAIFFPLPDSGTENPRTVLVSYYQEFNEKVFDLEEDGETVAYQNSEDGVAVSNFNDTLMVYMLLYGDGKAGYVMDEEGKKNLKKVFDEMNCIDAASSAVEMEVSDSLGKVWVTSSSTTVHNLTYKDYMDKHSLTNDQKEVLEELMSADTSAFYGSETIGAQVAQMAMTKVGCGYRQDKRMQEGWYDCSSLVCRLYKEAGIILNATASTQGRQCYQKAQIIDKKDLQPGDLIFYSYEDNGQFRNISHVAIYVGDGKMVHAANPSRGVVLDPLRTGSVVFYARPYQ